MYVIKKGNLYTTRPGRPNSYTNKLQYAEKFTTRESAERNKCGNEYIVPVDSELGNY